MRGKVSILMRKFDWSDNVCDYVTIATIADGDKFSIIWTKLSAGPGYIITCCGFIIKYDFPACLIIMLSTDYKRGLSIRLLKMFSLKKVWSTWSKRWRKLTRGRGSKILQENWQIRDKELDQKHNYAFSLLLYQSLNLNVTIITYFH